MNPSHILQILNNQSTGLPEKGQEDELLPSPAVTSSQVIPEQSEPPLTRKGQQ